MDLDNLLSVSGYSIVSDSIWKMFGSSMVSSSWIIIFDCSTGLKNQKQFQDV